MTRFLLICLGGALGTGARYLLGGFIANLGAGFPWGTLTVNALGSFLLALIMQVALASTLIGPTLRVALTTGVMGGFTTYSTFNYETLEFLRRGAWLSGGANLIGMVLACLVAGLMGSWLGARLAP